MSSLSNCNSICSLSENWCRTEIKMDEVRFIWVIDQFDFHEAIGDSLDSSVFMSKSNKKVKWYLKLGFNGKLEEKNSISLYLNLHHSSEQEKVSAQFSFSVLDAEQKEINIKSPRVREFTYDAFWGYANYCEKNSLNKSLINNTLKILCKVTISQSGVINTYHNCKSTPLQQLSSNLKSVLDDQKFTDVTLSVNGKHYQAHKAILAGRSKVFSAMFEHDLLENKQNVVNITDVHEDVFDQLLQFIYTGKCEKLEDYALELLAAADKYDIEQLKGSCGEAVFRNLTVQNATHVLILSDLHTVDELKNRTIEFIASNSAEILNSIGWKDVSSNPKLVNEVCLALSRRIGT